MFKSKGNPKIVHQQEVDQAIGEYLVWYWKEETEKDILRDFGADVLKEVRSLYKYVMDSPVDFNTYSLEQMIEKLSKQLMNEYPFLSDLSRLKLTNCFAYAYK